MKTRFRESITKEHCCICENDDYACLIETPHSKEVEGNYVCKRCLQMIQSGYLVM